MINQLWQTPVIRDYFGVWSPPAIRNLEVLNNADCFRPAWYAAPKFSERIVPERGYRQAQLTLPVGGYIYAFAQAPGAYSGSNVFQVMVTDLSLNRPLSNAPIESTDLRGAPYYLADLYPVLGNGNFRVEIWNPVEGSGDILAEVVLCVVEPKGE